MLPQKGTGLLWSSWGGCFGRCPSPWNDSRVQNLPCEYIYSLNFRSRWDLRRRLMSLSRKPWSPVWRKQKIKNHSCLRKITPLPCIKKKEATLLELHQGWFFFFFCQNRVPSYCPCKRIQNVVLTIRGKDIGCFTFKNTSDKKHKAGEILFQERVSS